MKNTVRSHQKTTLIKRHDDLLNAAKQIFGEGMIVDAWIVIECFGDISSYRDKLESEHSDFKDSEFYATIELPTHGAIMLEFCNGRHVVFGTSEWASIELAENMMIEV